MLEISGQANGHFLEKISIDILNKKKSRLLDFLNVKYHEIKRNDQLLAEQMQYAIEDVNSMFSGMSRRTPKSDLRGVGNLFTVAQNILRQYKYESYFKRAGFLELITDFFDQAAKYVDSYDCAYSDFREYGGRLKQYFSDTLVREAKEVAPALEDA